MIAIFTELQLYIESGFKKKLLGLKLYLPR